MKISTEKKKVCLCCEKIYEESIVKISILCPTCRRAGCDGVSQCKILNEHAAVPLEKVGLN